MPTNNETDGEYNATTQSAIWETTTTRTTRWENVQRNKGYINWEQGDTVQKEAETRQASARFSPFLHIFQPFLLLEHVRR
jgi:hypothetical protein